MLAYMPDLLFQLMQPDLAAQIVLAAGVLGLVKKILLGVLAIVNGVLAILATLAIWKSYLIVGAKVALTTLVLVPVVGVLAYLFWGQKKVRDAA